MKQCSIGAITYRTEQRYASINYFKKIAIAARQRGVPFFVFCVDDVDVEKQKIHGLWYEPKLQKWVRRWTPFPTIVYDHVRYHPTPQFKRYIKLRQSGFMRFSYNGYAHKLIVIDYLSSFPELAPYMPETEKIEQYEDFKAFVEKGPAIVKPINGTGGRDIYKIECEGNEYTIIGKETSYHNIAEREMKKWLESRIAQERHMVQRFIPIQYDGRTCDTRVLIQKDGDGKWSFTGMGTRIGRANMIASNLAKGARAIRTDMFIQQYLGLDPEPILAEIEAVGIQIAERLEQRFGSFVEFGLDIGIMPNGKFQLIEANSKPDRKIFMRTNQPEQSIQAHKKPLDYHIYLCKEQKNNPTN